MDISSLHRDFPSLEQLEALKPQMAASAQKIYNEWDGEEGGICDEIAQAIIEIVSMNFDVDVGLGGWEGDDHAFVVVRDQDEEAVYGIDIPCHIYERGGGYSWEKIGEVQFSEDDVAIWKY